MIKIGPLVTSEYRQVSALLKLQEEVPQPISDVDESEVILRSLTFWQHWLPCQLHVAPSIYVAREDNVVLGVICLQHTSKSRGCWEIDKLVIHPEHRGRGLAQELLRYVFAQFGSQGVMHFLAEVPALNEGALTLFAGCGFCRSSRITYYRLNPDKYTKGARVESEFRPALPHLGQGLFQLYSEVLPPALRRVLLLAPEDFDVREPMPFTSVERNKQKLMRSRVWYWISDDDERQVVTSSVKVKSEPDTGYGLEFAVHPGWKDLAGDLVRFTVEKLLTEVPRAPIWAKIYDFQGELVDPLTEAGFERAGETFLLLREHWQRAQKTKLVQNPAAILPGPVINFPLATDRSQLSGTN